MIFGEGLRSCPIADLFPPGSGELASAPPAAAGG